MIFQPGSNQSESNSRLGRSRSSLPPLRESKVPKRENNCVANNERRESNSTSRSPPILQSNKKNLVIHNCLINRMARIEDSLQILLDSYLEAPNTFSDEGYLPIHLACIYYPTNVKVVDIIMRAYPSGVIEPSKSPFVRSNTDYTILSKKPKTLKYHEMYPLHIAVANGASLDVVRLLTLQNAEILTKKDRKGNAPLTIAIKYNAKAEIIDFMLAENAIFSIWNISINYFENSVTKWRSTHINAFFASHSSIEKIYFCFAFVSHSNNTYLLLSAI